MDFLYPRDQEPAPGAQLTRTESLLVSVGAHLLLLLLLVVLPGYLPDSLRAFLYGVPTPPPAASEPTPIALDSLPAQDDPDPPEASVEQIPLQFAYVKLPADESVAENKDAILLSDRNRQARQDVSTPEDATSFTIDPHSEGDAVTREIPVRRLDADSGPISQDLLEEGRHSGPKLLGPGVIDHFMIGPLPLRFKGHLGFFPPPKLAPVPASRG